jgi:hypothetical protein
MSEAVPTFAFNLNLRRYLKGATALFLDSLSTFTTYELMPYNEFVLYTVVCATAGGVILNKHSTDVECKHTMSSDGQMVKPDLSCGVSRHPGTRISPLDWGH